MRTLDTEVYRLWLANELLHFIYFYNGKLPFNLAFINAFNDNTISYFVLAIIGLDFILNIISLDNYYVFIAFG